jgi:hypothetical protein
LAKYTTDTVNLMFFLDEVLGSEVKTLAKQTTYTVNIMFFLDEMMIGYMQSILDSANRMHCTSLMFLL